jgi:PAS domain S-box-containing protein
VASSRPGGSGGEGGPRDVLPAGALPGQARIEHPGELPEGRYEALVEHAPDAIVVLDLDAGRFVTANAAAERLFGLPRERLVQIGPTEVSPRFQPDGRPSREAADGYIALALQGETPRFDWVHLDAAGEAIPCEINLLRVPDPTRTLVRGSIIDVRDRRRAEEVARVLQAERDAALEQLSSILASAGDGIYGIDRDDRVTFANPAASRMLGWSVAEMVGGFAHERWHHSRPGGEPYPQSECPICAAARKGRSRTVTGEVFWRRDGGSFPVEYTCAPLLHGQRIVGTVCVFRDTSQRIEAEIARRDAAAQEAARLIAERLQIATSALSATMSVPDVAMVAVSQGVDLLGARRVELLEYHDGVLTTVGAGGDGPTPGPDDPGPAADAARSGGPVRIRSAAEWRERYPALVRRLDEGDLLPTISHPLPLGGRILGVMTLGFATAQVLDDLDLGALGSLAQQCGQAIERARLYEAEQRSGERQTFLAEASQLFSGTLEEQTVIEELARLCVPRIADWCVVNALSPSGVDTLAVAHSDPALVSWAQEASRRYPPDPDAPAGVAEVLRSGRSELIEDITDEMVTAAARDQEHLKLVRTLALCSAMTVPVSSGGRTLAAITLLMGESGRRYDEGDLRFAEDLARRAGLALDNARLYAEERRERRSASFLAEVSGALDAPLDVAERLERLVGLVVPRLADLCTVRLADPYGLPLAAVAAADPERERIARALYPRFVGPPEEAGMARVLTTVQAELVREVTDEMLQAYSPDQAFLEGLRALGPRSTILVPLIARGSAIGSMSLIAAESGRRYDDHDLALAEELGRRAGLAIDNARLLERERAARAEAEAARERVARLQSIGAALGSALGREEVARVIVAEGIAALGATAGAVALRRGDECVTLRALGYPPDLAAALERFPLSAPFPLAEAIRLAEPVWLESADSWWARFGEPRAPLPTGLALPLIVGGRAIGGIDFRFPQRERAFEDTERAFMLAFAAQCAQALERAERYEAEHRIALTLQRSLLPPPPPTIAGVTVALRYLPAGEGIEAGGDWYDVVALDDGRVGVAVGDVVGRGIEAAAVMGQLQSALRAFALQGEPPGAVITRLARFAAEVQQASMATVAYGLLDLESGELRYARAGHPPPLIVRHGGDTEYLGEGRGPPLTALAGADYEEGRATLDAGDALLLYSDGLIERRREVIDEGLRRLAQAAAGAAGAPAEEVCDRVLGALLGDRTPGDDVALLVLRRTPLQPSIHRRVAARPDALAPLRGELRRWLRAEGVSELETQDVLVACGEALSNAVEHAYREDEPGEVELWVSRDDGGLLVASVRDFGRWRAPTGRADRGRGLPLMEALMDAVDIVRERAGTHVSMRRRIEPPA